MGRSSSTKAEWLGALETAAKLGVEQCSAIWVWIMQELGLGPQYFLAIREAIQQGRWRTAKNPKAYIKTLAKREALKMGLVNEDSGNLAHESPLVVSITRSGAITVVFDKHGSTHERRKAAKVKTKLDDAV